MSYSKKFILALDVSTESEAIKWVKAFSPLISTFKVGKQLFISQGPRIIEQIRGLGGEVFLDLKLHDIPHTVYKASQSILNHSVFMFNAHALGGIEMLKASAKAVKEKPGALLIGVTVLTSHSKSDLVDMGINQPPSELALNLAKKCKEAGFDGVVCSVHEVEKIKSEIGTDFITVTPGIRLTDTEQRDDQKRVATPKQAIDAGADYLVVGRSFLTSKDPVGILQKTIEELG